MVILNVLSQENKQVLPCALSLMDSLLGIWAQWEKCHDPLTRSLLVTESGEGKRHTLPVFVPGKEIELEDL